MKLLFLMAIALCTMVYGLWEIISGDLIKGVILFIMGAVELVIILEEAKLA